MAVLMPKLRRWLFVYIVLGYLARRENRKVHGSSINLASIDFRYDLIQ